MIEFAALRLAPRCGRRHPLTSEIGVSRCTARRGIDQDRASWLAIHAQHPIAGVDPERVVAANRACTALPDTLEIRRLRVGTLAQLAANRWRAAIRVAWLLAKLQRRLRLLLFVARRFFRKVQRRVRAESFKRRDGGVGPAALQIRTSVRSPWNGRTSGFALSEQSGSEGSALRVEGRAHNGKPEYGGGNR